jgi:hypothetical protein
MTNPCRSIIVKLFYFYINTHDYADENVLSAELLEEDEYLILYQKEVTESQSTHLSQRYTWRKCSK